MLVRLLLLSSLPSLWLLAPNRCLPAENLFKKQTQIQSPIFKKAQQSPKTAGHQHF